jgi:hypothetical protein
MSQYRQAFLTAIDQARSHAIKVIFDHQGQVSKGR